MLTRRSFLRRLSVASGWLALARLTPRAAADVPPPNEGVGLHVLSPAQAEILTAVGTRMTDTDDPNMPTFAATAALRTIDAALLFTPEDARTQLGWLLVLFQWGPPLLILQFSRFTNLTAARQDDYIRAWAHSRLGILRIGFQALKNLSMFGYYAQDETWKGIGYRGPWAPRPRRVVVPVSG